MEITPGDIRIPPVPRTPNQLNAVVSQLKVGTILEAMVVSSDTDATVLKAGDQLFQAPPGAPIKPGQTILLRVEQLGPPLQLRLQLAPQPVQPNLQPFSRNISQLLPQQAELPQLLSNIAQLAAAPGPRTSALPEPLKQALRQLLDSMVTSRQASSAEGIKQAIRQSGLFLERNLLASTASRPTTTTPAPVDSLPNATQPVTTPPPVTANLRDTSAASALKATLSRLQALNPDKVVENKSQPPAASTSPDTDSSAGQPALPSTLGDLKAGLLKLLTVLQQLQTALPAGDDSLSADEGATTRMPMPQPSLTPVGGGSLPLRGHAPQAIAPGAPTLHDELPLQTIVKELHQETQQGLARLHLLQLAGIPTPDQPNPCWSFELPIRHHNSVDLFKLHISEQDEDSASTPGAIRSWLVQLSFNLESLGEVNAHVRLQGGKVNANIWTEFPQTATLFNDHLQRLQSRLGDQGLRVGEFHCQVGEPPRQDRLAHERNRIVDLKA